MTKTLQLLIFFCTLNIFAQSGTLDSSFGTGGKVLTTVNGTEDRARGVVLQDDGKIVVAGYTYSNVFGYDFLCIRYNTDGSLDSTFGTNGIATFDLQIGSDDRAYSIDIQLDGKLVLAGFSDDGSDRNGAVLRLNTDGTLDTSFGTSGIAITDVFESDIYKVVKIHHVTGNIVVGGTSYEDTNESNGILARYTSDGALDTSFNGSGKISALEPVIGSNAEVIELIIEDLAIKSNGRITAVGWVNNLASSFPRSDHYQCRINSDGTPDETFSEDGYDFDVYTTGWDRTFSVLMYPNDSFIVSGYTEYTATDYRTYIADTPSDGESGNSVDNWLQLSTSTQEVGYGMEFDNSGNVIIGGVSADGNAGTASFFLTSVDNSNDYVINSSFGNSGFVTTDFGTVSFAYDLKVQSDDKIVLAGFSDNQVALARYNGNTLSTTDFEKANNFSIYPNPVENTLYFKMLNNEFDSEKYDIYNVLGKNVLTGSIHNTENVVNVENLAAGFYFIRIGNEVIKFVKND
ncbi:T9SS type A sorting domain-containing protein [uncultured Winogradskyella sp.]|uniref:T9SS type A sorting domain-containing protein n=1 Tax=Winogradskyella sp. 4-2091 TaxID=3381659 RepID=UPI0026282078|nr:T9SS type A sorting domain-containing protein [uncultured Winogradskyella sp.]